MDSHHWWPGWSGIPGLQRNFEGLVLQLGRRRYTTYTTASWITFLTHWGRDKLTTIWQTTPSNTFCRTKHFRISIKMLLKFVSKGPINNIPKLVQAVVWCRPGEKPLSELLMVSQLTHACVTRPQWVKANTFCDKYDSSQDCDQAFTGITARVLYYIMQWTRCIGAAK